MDIQRELVDEDKRTRRNTGEEKMLKSYKFYLNKIKTVKSVRWFSFDGDLIDCLFFFYSFQEQF